MAHRDNAISNLKRHEYLSMLQNSQMILEMFLASWIVRIENQNEIKWSGSVSSRRGWAGRKVSFIKSGKNITKICGKDQIRWAALCLFC